MPLSRGNLLSPATRRLLLLFYLGYTLLPIVWLFLGTIRTGSVRRLAWVWIVLRNSQTIGNKVYPR